MKTLFTLLVLIISFSASAQETETRYFNVNFQHRTYDSKSKNKRVYQVTDSLIKIKDYKKNRLFRTGVFYGFKNLKNLDNFIWYHYNRQYDKNIKLKTKGRKGIVKYYNKTGELTSEQLYDGKETKYIQIWKNSKPCLVNGTGKCEYNYTEQHERFIRIFKDSVEVDSYLIRELKNDTLYYKTDTKAYPEYGLQKFQQYLASNIDYPNFAKIAGINKKIIIWFVVDENGNLTDFKPLNKKSFNFEKKTIEKLEKMPKWIPATYKGRNVKTSFKMPLTFKH